MTDAPLSGTSEETDQATLAVNTLRFLAVDAVQKAKSGHPGMPMGAAPMAYAIWRQHMIHDPNTPTWPNRDRFILSAGHGSMLLYGLLHLSGYPISMDDIKQFRQWGSKTPGHPEFDRHDGIETTTGPLGQGFANGVGMAMAEKWLAARFNRPDFDVVDHFTYAIVSDGDLMEGVSHEAASLAGHLGLGKLIYLYDDNHITIDGSTDLAYSDDVEKRFISYGWHVVRVEDGNDLAAIEGAIMGAKLATDNPSLILVRTHIGFGSPNKQDTSSAHGSPLGEEEIRLTRENLNWPSSESFFVPDGVYEHMGECAATGARARTEWEAVLSNYKESYPEEARQFVGWMNGILPENCFENVSAFEAGSSMATRSASGAFLEDVDLALPNLIGGSADLAGSNNTYLNSRGDFSRSNPGGGNFHFGVREHAMASIANGLALHGGVRPYCATFLIFTDYMRPAIRLAALMGLPVIYVMTHDSIGLGEDGPTHQPVEHVMALRAIPNLTVIRPADGNETKEAWKVALQNTSGPTLLVLTRQKVKTVDRSQYGSPAGVAKGAYVLHEPDAEPELILLATGSEVQLALDAAGELEGEGVKTRVVSMPSWELFELQSEGYKSSVLPGSVRSRVSIEAGITAGWERYVGEAGATIGMSGFGASAPAEVLFEQFGFTVENVLARARATLTRN